MSEPRRCVWTGEVLPDGHQGGSPRVFINAAARAAAHKAARIFGLSLIDEGVIAWGDLRQWWDDHQRHGRPAYTLLQRPRRRPPEPDPRQIEIPGLEFGPMAEGDGQ